MPIDEAAFPLGLQAGAMRKDSALLWTRFVADAVPPGAVAKLWVWRDGRNAGEVILVHELPVEPAARGYAHVPVSGLAPATWYRYAFFVEADGAFIGRTVVGRFRTAFPDDWDWPLTVAATTCTNFKFAPYVALQAMAEEPADLFLHLGDMSYNDGAFYLSEYEERWQRTLRDPGYRALLPRMGLYATWDDHEISNNFDPEAMQATAPSQLADAKQAFFETLAVERGPNDRLWRSYRWGRTAEFFVLDSRTERRPSTRESDEPIYLSPEQLAWLKQALEESPAHFKVLLNSVPMTNFPPPLWGLQGDRWQGYQAQRRALLDFIAARHIENVWFLSGDFHLGFVTRLDREGPDRDLWEIAVGPGGNGNNPLALVLEGDDPQNRELAFPSAQFAYASGDIAGTFLTFDPKQNAVRVRFVDPVTRADRYDAWLHQGD
ncbi:MAG: alkaline phosphatase D family protein [Myxococcaceae bacterium]|nr:alkaline phosphatase D family protein [Myxococcaceae bacterium]